MCVWMSVWKRRGGWCCAGPYLHSRAEDKLAGRRRRENLDAAMIHVCMRGIWLIIKDSKMFSYQNGRSRRFL